MAGAGAGASPAPLPTGVHTLHSLPLLQALMSLPPRWRRLTQSAPWLSSPPACRVGTVGSLGRCADPPRLLSASPAVRVCSEPVSLPACVPASVYRAHSLSHPSTYPGLALLLLVVRLMWSLTAQRRLSVITHTITRVCTGGSAGCRVCGTCTARWGSGGGRCCHGPLRSHSLHCTRRTLCSRRARWRTCCC